MSRAVWRTAVGAVAAVGMLAVATPAAAHVTVNPRETTGGGFARIDFRVPNESDAAATTQVEVFFPEETPVPSVSVAPVPGWSVEVSRRTLDEPVDDGHGGSITEAVESITWTADSEDAAVQPGQFLEFPVSMGRMPADGELFFRVLQTYSDGNVVRWIELPEGGVEPDFPAPSLRLAAAEPEDGAGEPVEGAVDGEAASPAEPAESGSAGVWLGLAGLVAGLGGLALGGVAFARTRQ